VSGNTIIEGSAITGATDGFAATGALDGNVTITDSTITGNTANGFFVFPVAALNANLTLDGSTISGATNGFLSAGSGVDGNVSITNSTLTGGSADGMQLNGPVNGFMTIADSTIMGDQLGVFVGGTVDGNLTLTNTTIQANNNLALGVDGDVLGNLTILDSTITSNANVAVVINGVIDGNVLVNPTTITGDVSGLSLNGPVNGDLSVLMGSTITGTTNIGLYVDGVVSGDVTIQGDIFGGNSGLFFNDNVAGNMFISSTITGVNDDALFLGDGNYSIMLQDATLTGGERGINKNNNGDVTIVNNNSTVMSTTQRAIGLGGTSGEDSYTGTNDTVMTAAALPAIDFGADADTFMTTGGTYSQGGGAAFDVIHFRGGDDMATVEGFGAFTGILNGGSNPGDEDTLNFNLWGVTPQVLNDILAQAPATDLGNGTYQFDNEDDSFTIGDKTYSWEEFENAFITGTDLAAIPGLTPNQQAIANSLNPAFFGSPGADMQFVLTQIVSLGTGAFPEVANQLSPQRPAQAFSNIIFNNSTFKRRDIDRDISRAFGGNGLPGGGLLAGIDASQFELIDPTQDLRLQRMDRRLASLGLSSGFASDMPGAAFGGLDLVSDSKYLEDSKKMIEAPLSDPNRFGLWLAGQGIIAEVDDGDADIQDFDYDTYDISVGLDYKVTREFVVGALFNYGHTDANLDSNGSQLDVDSYTGGLYAGYQSMDDGWFGNAFVMGGGNSIDQSRRIVFGAINRTADGDSDGWQISTGASGGYLFDLNREGTWRVGPTAGVQYTHLELDGYTETGAGALNLILQDQDADSFRTALGGRLEGRWQVCNDLAIVPSITAEWLHEFLDDSRGINAAFSDPAPGSFIVNTSDPDRDFGLIGVNLDFLIGESWSAYLAYDAQFSGEYFGNGITGGARFEF